MKKEQESNSPLIATIVVAAVATICAVIAIILISLPDKNGEDSAQTGDPASAAVSSAAFSPSDELIEECLYAAHDLVADSYTVLQLFVTTGLPYKPEPYNNYPDDGIYTVDTERTVGTAFERFTTYDEIRDFVNSIYVESEAGRILTNIDGNGMAVYKNRDILVTVQNDPHETTETADTPEKTETGESADAESSPYITQTVLGINAEFKPDEDYNKDWGSIRIAVEPKSEIECELTVYLDGYDENAEITEENESSVLHIAMLKVDGEWRLSVFDY